MQTHDTAPHLATLTRALGNKIGSEITESELEAELQKYMEYGVPPDQAVRTILRAHGVQSNGAPQASTGSSEPPVRLDEGRTKLNDLPGNAQAANILARVLSMNTRTVNARGEDKEIIWGMLGDETAAIPYTSWRPLEGLAKGDVIEVEGIYTKEYRGETQINFGDRCKITKRDADALPAQPDEWTPTDVADLKPGMRAFQLTGRFLEVAEKQVNVRGEPKTILTGHFADATGKIEFTCWDPITIESGSAVTIKGASIRTFQSQNQLNFDSEVQIEAFTGDVPDAKELDVIHPVPVSTVTDKGNMGDVAVRATLLEVRPGSGLIWRDPETRRVVPSGGEATPDLRIKFVLDDGTSSVTGVVGRAETERLLGKTLDQCIEEAKTAMRPEVIAEQIAQKVEGRVFLAQGFSRSDEYGTMLIARTLVEDHEDAEGVAGELLDALATEVA